MLLPLYSLFFFFNDTATTEIYTLSLHDALPISAHGLGVSGGDGPRARRRGGGPRRQPRGRPGARPRQDRKSTRLNSSHLVISYAVFCLKKKKKVNRRTTDDSEREAKARSACHYV